MFSSIDCDVTLGFLMMMIYVLYAIRSFIHSFCVCHSFIQRSSTDFLCECRSFCLFHSFIHSVFHSFIHSFCVSFIQLTQEYFAVNSNFCTSSFPYALIHVLIANNNEAAEQQQRGNPEEDEAAIAAAAALVAASHQQRRRSSEEALRYVFLTETRVGGGEADSYVLRSPDHFEIRNGRGQRHKIMKKCDRPTDGQKRVVKSACTRLKKTVLLAIIFTATIRWSLQQSRTGRSLQQRRTRGRSLLPEGLE